MKMIKTEEKNLIKGARKKKKSYRMRASRMNGSNW